jgi:hypothetical protein
MTQGGFGTALAGSVAGTVGTWVTSWFGMFSAYDLHSTSAPSLFGTDNFQNQRTCLSCGASLLRYTFAGYETADRFGYFFGKYEQNGPYDPAEFIRDPYLHVVSLGAIGSVTEQGSSWKPAATHIAQLAVGSTAAGAPSINLPQDVSVQGRWAYVTGQAISGTTYAGALLGKVFVGGPEGTGTLPGSWASWVDPTNKNGYRVTTWQRSAAVIAGDNQANVYFYDTCANAACNPTQLLGGTPYTASSARGGVFAYGRYLYLGSMYVGDGNTVEILDMTPLTAPTPSMPTLAGVIASGRGCRNVYVTGDRVFCTDGAGHLDVYDISSIASAQLVASYPLNQPNKLDVFGPAVRAAAGDWVVLESR